MAKTREFVLLHRLLHGTGGNTADTAVPAGFTVLPLPAGRSFLSHRRGHRRGQPRLVAGRPRKAAVAVTFEPVQMQGRPYLLMLLDGAGAGTHHGVRHNGHQAWPVNLLRVKDEVLVDGVAYFVSAQRGESVLPAAQEHIGVECPVCRLRFEAGTQLYACGGCGTWLHCEDERWPAEQRFECARLARACPKCKQDIDFRMGLEWEPEL